MCVCARGARAYPELALGRMRCRGRAKVSRVSGCGAISNVGCIAARCCFMPQACGSGPTPIQAAPGSGGGGGGGQPGERHKAVGGGSQQRHRGELPSFCRAAGFAELLLFSARLGTHWAKRPGQLGLAPTCSLVSALCSGPLMAASASPPPASCQNKRKTRLSCTPPVETAPCPCLPVALSMSSQGNKDP